MDEQRPATQGRLRAEYQSRINRVFDYVEANLGTDLDLATLAGVATFSPYHFHRIFRAMVGETLNQFIGRVRVEKAAALLLNNRATPVTEIALDCGFSGSATFARAFRERFGVSASEWRAAGGVVESKIRKTESKNGQSIRNDRKECVVVPNYSISESNHLLWEVTMKSGTKTDLEFKAEVRELPDMTVAYVRHVGPYMGDGELFGSLAWSWEDDYRGDWPDPSVIYQRVQALNQTDLAVGYRKDDWSVRAYVENVFDGVWYDGNYANDDPDPTIIFAEHTFGPSRPRTMGVRFSYNWGG